MRHRDDEYVANRELVWFLPARRRAEVPLEMAKIDITVATEELYEDQTRMYILAGNFQGLRSGLETY
jgi:hypothetical protein